MPAEAFNWMGRIKTVEREYRAIRFGTDRLIAELAIDPTILIQEVRRPDIKTAAGHLEGTYIVRVFSEFETALGHFTSAFGIPRPRTARALIERVRSRGRISQADTDAVHRVREYRNVLVHERSAAATPVSIRETVAFLCTFLSRVQGIW